MRTILPRRLGDFSPIAPYAHDLARVRQRSSRRPSRARRFWRWLKVMLVVPLGMIVRSYPLVEGEDRLVVDGWKSGYTPALRVERRVRPVWDGEDWVAIREQPR